MPENWLSESIRFSGFHWDNAKEFYPMNFARYVTLHDAHLLYPFYVEPEDARGTLVTQLDWFWHKNLTAEQGNDNIMVLGFSETTAVNYIYESLNEKIICRTILGMDTTEHASGFRSEIDVIACPLMQIDFKGTIQVLVYDRSGQLVDIPWAEFNLEKQS